MGILKKNMVPTKEHTLLFFILPIFVIAISYVMSQSIITRIELDNFTENIRNETRQNVVLTKNLLDSMAGSLENTAHVIDDYDDVWDPDVKKIVEYYHELNTFDFTFISDKEGNAYSQTGYEFSVANKEYFERAMDGNVVFSEIMPSKRYAAVQIIAYPLYSKENEIKGVLFGLYDIETFSRLLNSVVNNKYEICVIDSRGRYINKFDSSNHDARNFNFWQDLENSGLGESKIDEIKHNFQAGNEGEYSCIYKGNRCFGCYMPLGVRGWQVLLTAEGTTMNSHIRAIRTVDVIDSIVNIICLSIMLLSVYVYFKNANSVIQKANQKANKNIEMMQMAVESSNQIIFEYDVENKRIELKTEVRNPLFRSQVLSPVPDCFFDMHIVSEDSVTAIKNLFKTIQTEQSSQAEIQLCGSNQETFWYRVSMHNMYNEQGKIDGTVGSAEDITKLKKGEAALKRKEEIDKTLTSHALLYARADLDMDMIQELNGKETHMSYQNFLKNNIVEKVSEEHQSYVTQSLSAEALHEAYQQGKEFLEVQCLMKSEQGTKWVSCLVYRIHACDESKVTLVIMDIDVKKRSEIALKQQAEHDGLTGLYNAATTRAKISEILSSQYSSEQTQIFILIDLDNFKKINDTFGHVCGDQVLIDVAKVLNRRFRSSDILGRLGGDEFVVMLSNVRSDKLADHLLSELHNSLTRVYTQGNVSVTVSASIGIAIAPSDGTTFGELYKKADAAMYRVKKEGKNGYRRCD